tara:strand:+ start:1370 stop:1507 length:138 start_codon:yes stop_codon:yes gene_type:complete
MFEIVVFGVGFISGMYICTQLEISISKNINNNKLKKNLEKLNKND